MLTSVTNLRTKMLMKQFLRQDWFRGTGFLGLVACFASALVVSAAEPAGRYEAQGSATFQAEGHIYDNGFRDGIPEFITRYSPLRGFDGDDYPGYFVDLARLKYDLIDRESGRPVFGIDRTSLAYFNQKNALYYDPDVIRLDLRHSLYRSQQMKPDNRPDPAAPANSIFAIFNDDSFGRQDYFVRRNDYGVTLKLRPWLFGEDGTHLGDIDLSYDRSERDSVRYFDYVLTRRLAGGSQWERVRWRGIDQRVIEDVDRGGLGISATPFQWIGMHYQIYVEKYDRSFNNSTLADVARIANVPVTPWSAAAASSGPLTFIDRHNTEFWPVDQVSLGWVPSTTKLVNTIKFDKSIGPGVLNFGYANVYLDQDDFTPFAIDRGFERGQIITHSAFGNWNMLLTRSIGWNTHINYRLRDNRSTFPALDPNRRSVNQLGASVFDYINPILDGGKHGGVFGPFIDQIETFKFGTDFTFALPVASSRIVAGWEREDTSRDLIWGDPPAGQVRTIDPNEAFVRPDSVNDTFFLNFSARPVKNLRFRWNNSVTVGDEVGLVTEAETGYKSRVGLGYYMPNVLKGATVDLFYQLRYSENDAFVITSLANPPASTFLSSARQEQEQLFQSAGLTFTIMPTDPWTAYAGYVWNRDSLEANFMRTTARRYDNNWVFAAVNSSRYLTDAHTLFLGSSYQFAPRWLGTVDYSVTGISGELGSGDIEEILGRENELDNITHHVATGLNYHVTTNGTIGARYTYSVYHDSVNRRLNSGYHTIGILATIRF
jgi:hypothetical protein